jgi:hypothetical protein
MKGGSVVSKAQAFLWLSMAVLAFAPFSMAIGPLGFFDGPRGD